MQINQIEIIIRLTVAMIIGGVVGYERETRGRAAGTRTHALVSSGAALMALIQLETTSWLLDYLVENPEFATVLSTDITRFIAQVISGIGFLGAGTIIVSQRSITGLTTAASLWTVAGLGISVGMGYYLLGIYGVVIILIVLRVIDSLFRMDKEKNIEIQYVKGYDVTKFNEKIFDQENIKIISEDYSVTYKINEEQQKVTVVYRLLLPYDIQLKELINKIGENKYILKITTLKWN